MTDNRRSLHWVFKIGNLKTNHHFYVDVLGMKVLRHEEFGDGCEASCNGPYARPWSKTMIGYGNEIDHFVFELTYNYGIKAYKRGDDFRNVSLRGRSDILARCEKEGYEVHDEDGETFLLSPDGYKFVLVDEPVERDPVIGVSVNVADLERSRDYYVNVLKMTEFASSGDGVEEDARATFGYAADQGKLEVVQRKGLKGQEIAHEKAFGRIAFAITDITPVYEAVKASNDKVLHEPVTLPTPGKADVVVVIVQDRDDYEICFVGEAGFNDLSAPQEGADAIDWEARAENGADKPAKKST